MERSPMTPEQRAEVLQHLARDFSFKTDSPGKTLRGGICPQCGHKSLWVNSEQPWLIHCGRLNGCKPAPYEASVRQLWSGIFNNWKERAEKQAHAQHLPIAQDAVANLYMKEARGFDLDMVKGWYTQEAYYDRKLGIGTPTVRFKAGGRDGDYWERLIENTDKLGRKANWKPGAETGGTWWCPPSFKPDGVEELWIVEGIFDAIALLHHGIHAVAIHGCTNYPDKALKELAVSLAQKGKHALKLVWALDSDKAGSEQLQAFFLRAEQEGWTCEAAQIPQPAAVKIDWNDCHIKGKLEADDIALYKYNGQLLTAKSAYEKAMLLYMHEKLGNEFHFDYHNSMYWFFLNLDKFNNVRKDIERNEESDKAEGLTDEEIREKALRQVAKVTRIAMFKTTALYFQLNQTTGIGQYYYLVEFPHKKRRIKAAFTGSQLSAPGEFKKRLLEVAGGPVYKATSMQHDSIIEKQTYDILSIDTVDYVGYAPEYKAYLLDKVAVQNGQMFKINKDDYFNLPGGLNLKTTGQSSVPLNINIDFNSYNTEWPRLLWQAFGVRGYIALAFWFGSLFAEQIKEFNKSLTFFEICGQPGSGKTTLLNFLWKLFGRLYEGVDPEKATAAARARLFAQTSNMPVALIESDRSDHDKFPKQRAFDWDEMKSYYNLGARLRARGVATGGNEVYEPLFRGAFVIAQNQPIENKEAIMQRICQIQILHENNNAATLAAARKLEALSVDEVSNFMLRAVMTESETMQIIKERVHRYEDEIMERGEVKVQRIALNHAQIRAMADALAPVIDMTEEQLAQVHETLINMAGLRQVALNCDSQIVQNFWDAYDYLHRPGASGNRYELNHSKKPDELIAINLNHFYEMAREANQSLPDITELKKELRESKYYKFIGYRTVDSAIRNGSVRCYVFKNPKWRET